MRRARVTASCDCEPTWQAWVYSQRDRRKIRRSFPTHAAARSWRAQAQREVETGARRASSRTTVRQAADAFLEGARSGRDSQPLRGALQALSGPRVRAGASARVLPAMGGARLAHVTTADLQRLVDRWQSEGGMSASTIRNTVKPLAGDLPPRTRSGGPARQSDCRARAARGARTARADRPARHRCEAARGPAARTARFGRLRSTPAYGSGSRAPGWDAVDLAGGVVEVRESWDPKSGRSRPRARAGRRKVPMPAVLRDALVEHRMRTRREHGLVFLAATASAPSRPGRPQAPAPTAIGGSPS